MKKPLILIDEHMIGQQYLDKVLKTEVLKAAIQIKYNLGN